MKTRLSRGLPYPSAGLCPCVGGASAISLDRGQRAAASSRKLLLQGLQDANQIFCSRSWGASRTWKTAGGGGGGGEGPGIKPRQPTPSSTGWDPRGFPSNRVPRRARGGTLAAFRLSWAPGLPRAGRPPSRRTRRGAEVKVSVQPAPSVPSHGGERSRGSGAAPSRAGCSRAAPQKLRSGAGVASAGVSPFGSGISPIATSS